MLSSRIFCLCVKKSFLYWPALNVMVFYSGPQEPEERFTAYYDMPIYDYTSVASPTVPDEPEPSTEPAELAVTAESSAPAATGESISNEGMSVPNLNLDPQLLEVLGAFEEEKTDWGEPIVDQIAIRLKPLLLNGLKKEEKENLLKKFPFPKNFTLTKAPTLNAEVNTMLSETNRNRDKRLYNKQNQLGSALSGLTKATSLLLCKEPKIPEILSILSDTSKILADSHYLETDTRKSLVMPLIDKELVDTFKDRKRDEFLFGDKIGELVKNSRGIRKTGQLIKAPAANNLNSKGPSSRYRQLQSQKYVTRGGGYQRPYRRRTAPSQPSSAVSRRQQTAPRRQPAATTLQHSAQQPATTVTERTTGATH